MRARAVGRRRSKRLVAAPPSPFAQALQLAAPAAYILFAIAAVAGNKVFLSGSSGINAPFFLMTCQAVVALACSAAFFATGATWSGRPLIDPPSWQALRRALPLGASAVLNTGLGLTALRSMPVPLYGAVRRSGVVVTLAMETLTGQAPAAALSTRTRVATAVASVLVVVGAAAAAVAQGVRDVPLLGLALTLTSNVVTAVNGSLVSALSVGLLDASPTASRAGPDLKQKRRLAPFTLMFYNAAVMAPLSLLIALATGELAVLRTMQWSGATVAYLLLSSVLGICVTVCAFWTTEAFSPLASAIAGNIKDVPLLFMPWSDFTPTLLGYAGVALNLGGSSLFVLARSG